MPKKWRQAGDEWARSESSKPQSTYGATDDLVDIQILIQLSLGQCISRKPGAAAAAPACLQATLSV